MHAKAEQHLKEAREIPLEARGRQRERRMSECKDSDTSNSTRARSSSSNRRGRSLSTDRAPRASASPSPLRKETDNPIIVPRYSGFDHYGKDVKTEKFSGGAKFGRL